MMIRALCLGVGLLALVGEAVGVNQNKQDPESLQGKWKVVASEFEGRPATAAYRPGTLIVIEPDELYFTDGFAKSGRTKFKIDATRKPKTIDLGDAKKAIVGIYLLDGDSLKLCLSLGGERPKEFATKAGDKTNLLTLKREK